MRLKLILAKLTEKAMSELEKRLGRLPYLEKWFVCIAPISTTLQL